MHPSFNREMCLKCPDRGILPSWLPGTTCYSCPAGKSMGVGSSLSWQGHSQGHSVNLVCFDDCPAGSFLSPRIAPFIVTSDKLRCFKTNAAAPTVVITVAEVAPANSTFFVTM